MTAPDRPTTQPPTALTIAGSDSSGGAGLQADLKTFFACRVHGLSAITAVTVQNSLGVSDVHELPGATVAAQIAAVAGDIGVRAAKTGMLASAEIIDAVTAAVRDAGIERFVVDPVSASQHGDPLLHDDAMDALRTTLIPTALLLTPNLFEVRLLVGMEVTDRAGMAEAARALHDLGPRWVLVKGGHLPAGDALDLLYDGVTFTEFSTARIATVHNHGSGDSLAASITAALACGLELPAAVAQGKRFVTECVAASYPLGAGRGPVGQFWRTRSWP